MSPWGHSPGTSRKRKKRSYKRGLQDRGSKKETGKTSHIFWGKGGEGGKDKTGKSPIRKNEKRWRRRTEKQNDRNKYWGPLFIVWGRMGVSEACCGGAGTGGV